MIWTEAPKPLAVADWTAVRPAIGRPVVRSMSAAAQTSTCIRRLAPTFVRLIVYFLVLTNDADHQSWSGWPLAWTIIVCPLSVLLLGSIARAWLAVLSGS